MECQALLSLRTSPPRPLSSLWGVFICDLLPVSFILCCTVNYCLFIFSFLRSAVGAKRCVEFRRSTRSASINYPKTKCLNTILPMSILLYAEYMVTLKKNHRHFLIIYVYIYLYSGFFTDIL